MIDFESDPELNDEIKRLFDEIKNFKDENDDDEDLMSEIESRLGLPFDEFEYQSTWFELLREYCEYRFGRKPKSIQQITS